ncbi:CRISPR-associated helicase Cas3' [Natranaerofaba carboxydovora]|uniref:CRISPR-associated helicase Cas3' n=1 Tax=Natranaerofaba carboxydovora TaxID=2742683 RepID=UPI001F13E70E|nr:CRISPR-associated helicase Cas3' [Natranaerofaba carboxydovora]UMZ73540.1 CRISPR-associated endonuclease/helicase Cas3 [Natranaerofaba carboxydovora]
MLAKKNPTKSILEHSEEAKEKAKELKEILINFSIFNNRLFELLEIAAFYHDIGKANQKFQERITKNIKRMFEDEVPHNLLSACMLKSDLGLNKDEEKSVVLAIAFHHNVSTDKANNAKLKDNLKELENNKEYLVKKMGIDFDIRKENIRKLSSKAKHINSLKSLQQFILLKGFLHRVDYAASSGLEIESGWEESIYDAVNEYMECHDFKKNKLQEFAENNCDNNIISIAQTGMGKTESALLWAGNYKLFFTLPIRVSSNAIFHRAKEMGIKSAGLIHSTSLDFLEYYGDDFTKVYDESRLLAKKLTVSTIDQIMKFPMLYPGFERDLTTLAYSKVVIDEIQAYDPDVAALLIKGLELINKMGGNFYVMTATLPAIYKEELEKRIPNMKIDKFVDEPPMLRHRVQIENDSILNADEEIRKASIDKKILVIVNTVDTAIKLYNKLKEEGANLLHSRFTMEHRSELESKIIKFSGQNQNGIWITTQIVEASLDIDFDFLFTEASPLDSLFQRLGRCYRRRPIEDDKINVKVFTNHISGYGTVYDKFLINKSIELLDGMSDLEETIKIDLVDKLYSVETLKQQEKTKFLTQFNETLRWLDDLYENIYKEEMSKREAQTRLRKLKTINIIPEYLTKEVQSLIKDLKTTSDENNKRDLKRTINMKTVSIQDFSTDYKQDKRLINKELIDEDLNLFRLPSSKYYYYEQDKSGLIL